MKINIISFLSISFLLFACSSEEKKETKNEDAPLESEVVMEEENSSSEEEKEVEKDVVYYYNEYIKNVDSEDPSIGVTPRKIVSQDVKKGIITYKSGGDSEIKKAQLYHLDGFDYFDHPGDYLLIQGENTKSIDIQEEPMELAMKVAGARSARGGECEYDENPELKVIKNKLCIVLHCLDDENFAETIGYITMKNGKMKVVEL